MKVTTDIPKSFVPVNLTLTFESQAELNAFGALFKYSPIAGSLRTVSKTIEPSDIYNKIKDLGGDIEGQPFEDFRKEIKRILI